MVELCAHNITVQKRHKILVNKASFTLKKGEFVALLGPNGAGKTSLVRASLGLIKPNDGYSRLNGQKLLKISASDRAKSIAYLPQFRPLAWPNRVYDIVALGRFSHGSGPGFLREIDSQAVKIALEMCELSSLANRTADTLSGGELARMHCARAFATQAPLLIADEPIAALDPRHQFRVLDIISEFVRKGGGALVILHDISLAAKYASRLIWMKQGRVVADGPTKDTLTTEYIEAIYGVSALIKGSHIQLGNI